MKQQTTKRYYALHSWVGILTAILLFIIAFTGAVSVFGRGELKVWANPDIRGQLQHDFAAIEKIVRNHASSIDPDYLEHVELILPGSHGANTLIILFEKETIDENGVHRHEGIWFDHHPQTLAQLDRKTGDLQALFQQRRTDMADFIVNFHADLHLGSPLGLILTGLLGLTLFASAITGLFIHPKMLKDLFTFRPWRSLRLLFTDTHKVLGTWGILFHGTIAYTGAFLGLATVLLIPASAFVSFGGDQEKLIETFLPEVEVLLTEQSAEMNFGQLLDSIHQGNPEWIIGSATFYGWGDQNAVMALRTLGGSNLTSQTHQYRISSGEHLQSFTPFGRLQGTSKYILDAMTPLHFGNFGGVAVKILWFLLGITTALVAVTGILVWVERRAFGSEGSCSMKTYSRISRFSSGSCAGLVLACISLFWAQLLMPKNLTSMGFNLGVVFFVSWIVAICWAMSRPNAYLATKEILLACGFLLLLVLPLNGITTGDWIVTSLLSGQTITAGVDLGLLLTSVILIWAALKLPTERPERKKLKHQHAPSEHHSSKLAASLTEPYQ